MIWFLLYPFRGTTEPPVLAPTHPLRRTFYKYGSATARHWLAFILCSVAIAVLFCYPVFFLYENPTTGFSKLPYHVWTSARLYDGEPGTKADVEIRQVWVHGSYMRALEQGVLLETLRIQDTIVKSGIANGYESTDDDDNASTTKAGEDDGHCHSPIEEGASWGFHSPLMFWNCSSSAVSSDANVLNTINNQTHRRSYLDLTLRPTSVFAGKSFDRNQVIAADALVITLFDRAGNGTYQEWDDRLSLLAKGVPKRWSMYPRDGQLTNSRLYEFQQKPMSIQDNILLGISYLLMGVYVLISLGKLRAVKSKVGLIVTAIFELVVSITASFSICGILHIDLARIPDAAYPFVVLVMGLENMFRLITAVLSQPPEQLIIPRIASAVGEVGHLSLATAAQMLFTLWILAKFAPSVSAFCTFAAVALIFDFILHFTFFLAVLGVDVRRMELGDSLERANIKGQPGQRLSAAKIERHYWFNALLQGQLPFSSRIAGSAISISFILGLNMHFYESGSMLWSLVQSLKSMVYSRSLQNIHFSPPPPINQARTPAAWLRIQDYRYAQEVLEFVKPKAHNIIARVYDPLTIVLHHSDRSGVPAKANSGFFYFWSLAQKHLYPFALAIIFSVATVTLLMQYMLWNELPEDEPEEESAPSILSIMTLPKAHRIDVIKLATCGKGHLVSVSLDRLVSISLYDPTTHTYSLAVLSTAALTPPLWPIVAITIDDTGTWAALCNGAGDVAFWNIAETQLSHQVKLPPLWESHPDAFQLLSTMKTGVEMMSLMVVNSDGLTLEVDLISGNMINSFEISQEKLVCASAFTQKSGNTIVALNRSGAVCLAVKVAGEEWDVAEIANTDAQLAATSEEGKVKSITVVPLLNAVALVRLRIVSLVDVETKALIYTFPRLFIKGRTLRVFHSTKKECPYCHSTAVHSLSLAYTDFESLSCVMRTYTQSENSNNLICLAPAPGRNCKGLSRAKETQHIVKLPGSWEATGDQSVIGIRMRPTLEEWLSSSSSGNANASGADITNKAAAPVKFKNRSYRKDSKTANGNLPKINYQGDMNSEWETWTLSSTGEFQTQSLDTQANAGAQSIGEDDLFVASPGPMTKLGNRSVAVGFGNRVKVVMVGNERFEQDVDLHQDLAHAQGGKARRRRTAKGKGV
ncbi:hypothetical protein EJ08DRAFT_733614 [Tothia fuscella]|uniref:Sterol regulatory element-binding protein cleavage-activating protein n=1 Tax=Tothia fuscella TaxID=1048955 RepID=A0A9P4TZ79_9PEZI|nr:hypothetical protein EJ08DRAFT_733614 [Tothia fuscella]